MSDFVNNGYELSWDAEIQNEGQEFVVAEPGDYNFTVTGFERARFAGSDKMPPCNQAKLTIKLEVPGAAGECTVKHNLFMHSKTEWKISEFLLSIGQKKKGESCRPNWNAIIGARGRCKVSKRSFRNRDGKELWTNDIDKFYAPEDGDLPFTMGQTRTNAAPSSAPSWQGGKF